MEIKKFLPLFFPFLCCVTYFSHIFQRFLRLVILKRRVCTNHWNTFLTVGSDRSNHYDTFPFVGRDYSNLCDTFPFAGRVRANLCSTFTNAGRYHTNLYDTFLFEICLVRITLLPRYHLRGGDPSKCAVASCP